jgi:hypothetical protein
MVEVELKQLVIHQNLLQEDLEEEVEEKVVQQVVEQRLKYLQCLHHLHLLDLVIMEEMVIHNLELEEAEVEQEQEENRKRQMELAEQAEQVKM